MKMRVVMKMRAVMSEISVIYPTGVVNSILHQWRLVTLGLGSAAEPKSKCNNK
jgi:hypothetical protein